MRVKVPSNAWIVTYSDGSRVVMRRVSLLERVYGRLKSAALRAMGRDRMDECLGRRFQ